MSIEKRHNVPRENQFYPCQKAPVAGPLLLKFFSYLLKFSYYLYPAKLDLKREMKNGIFDKLVTIYVMYTPIDREYSKNCVIMLYAIKNSELRALS